MNGARSLHRITSCVCFCLWNRTTQLVFLVSNWFGIAPSMQSVDGFMLNSLPPMLVPHVCYAAIRTTIFKHWHTCTRVVSRKSSQRNQVRLCRGVSCGRTDQARVLCCEYIFTHGPTYYGINHTSWTEYVFAPWQFVQHLTHCCTLTRVGRALQVIPDANSLRDHVPLLFKFSYHVMMSFPPTGHVLWDQDKISLCFSIGIGRAAFLQDLVRACRDRLDEYNARAVDNTTDSRYDIFLSIVKDVSELHFSKHSKPFFKTDSYLEMDAERARLLKERWQQRLTGNTTFAISLRLQCITRQLHGIKRKYYECVRQCQLDELWECYRARPRNTAQIYRLTRSLASSRTGPKRRTYHTVNSSSPTIAEWKRDLLLPGPQGGISGVDISFERVREVHKEECQPS